MLSLPITVEYSVSQSVSQYEKTCSGAALRAPAGIRPDSYGSIY